MSVQSLTTEETELVKTPTSIKAPVLWSKWFEEAKDSLSTNFEHHVVMNPWATSVETNQVKITFMLLEWIFYMTTLCYKKMISYSRNSSPSRPDLQVHMQKRTGADGPDSTHSRFLCLDLQFEMAQKERPRCLDFPSRNLQSKIN